MNCSNNRLDGPKHSRTKCFQKGYRMGSTRDLPQPPVAYSPVLDLNIYCGSDASVPIGYSRHGFPHECLNKGYGVGRAHRNAEYSTYTYRSSLLVWSMLLLFITGSLFTRSLGTFIQLISVLGAFALLIWSTWVV